MASYTIEDKEILVQLIKKYPVIESKETNAANIKKKNESWEYVAKEYNACRNTEKRSTIQLKRCWDKIKRKRKLDIAQERHQRMGTGGGPSIPDKYVIPDIDTVVPHLTVEIPNPYDSDGIIFQNVTEEVITDTPKTTNEDKGEEETFNLGSKEHEPPLLCSTSYTSATKKSNPNTQKNSSNMDELLRVRLENAKLEQEHLKLMNEIQLKTAQEKYVTACTERRIAETNLKIREKILSNLETNTNNQSRTEFSYLDL